MFSNRTNNLSILKYAAVFVLAALIVAYAIWRSLDYARGPVIEIFSPTNGISTTSNTVTIRGRADRVNTISLNGRVISIDEQGNFSETVLVFPGENLISLTAHDQFGRQTETIVNIVGTK